MATTETSEEKPYCKFVRTLEPLLHWSTTDAIKDISYDHDGNLLACNGTSEVIKFDETGVFVLKFDVGEKRQINGIHCTDTGDIVMTDGKSREVIVCDQDGKVTAQFGKEEIKYPTGVAVSKDNKEVFIVDGGKQNVARFTREGTFLNTISQAGEFMGRVVKPEYVTLDKEGNVLVSDNEGARIQVYTPEGKFIRCLRGRRMYGIDGIITSIFEDVGGMASNDEGNICVGTGNGVFVCKNIGYGPLVGRVDVAGGDAISRPKGLAIKGSEIAVATAPWACESTIEIYQLQ